MTLTFVIRDGLESDIPLCLDLDHSYETDSIWQMDLREIDGQWQAHFRPQRLPRTLSTRYVPSAYRLTLSLPTEHAFIVAASKDGDDILAYLSMRAEPFHQTAWVQDLVVARPFRRHRIGTRLIGVARAWAKEKGLSRLTLEPHTQNYPAILFAQQLGFRFCGYNDQLFATEDIAVFFTQMVR